MITSPLSSNVNIQIDMNYVSKKYLAAQDTSDSNEWARGKRERTKWWEHLQQMIMFYSGHL